VEPADGRQVDSPISNNGHLLWSGIVDKSKAKAVVRQLMGERLFSGRGVRTLAVGEGPTACSPQATRSRE
jgi:glycogen debranching enzyme